MAWKLTEEQIAWAQETERLYGVPASVTLGQFITESGAGTSGLFKVSNNGFGIIGSYNGNKVWYNDRYWRVYPSLYDSFMDHGRLLASDLYASKTKNATTVDEYIDAFVPIYAPGEDGNDGYPALLRAVIRDNNLTQYDGQWQGKAGSLAGSTSGTLTTSDGGGVLVSIMGTVIKVVSFLFLFILAVIFFAQAFELPGPVETGKKIAKKKAGVTSD